MSIKQNNKQMKRIIGGSLILVAGISAFYQWQFSKVKKESTTEVIVATKDIMPYEELTTNNIAKELRSVSSIVEGTAIDYNEVLGTLASTKIIKEENVNTGRVISKEEKEKLDLRLVSVQQIEGKDSFVAYEMKPFDKVDVLYYDKEDVYSGEPFLEGVHIFDMKSEDGLSYANRSDSFKAKYATLWVKKDLAEKMSALQSNGGYFKFILHRERAEEGKDN